MISRGRSASAAGFETTRQMVMTATVSIEVRDDTFVLDHLTMAEKLPRWVCVKLTLAATLLFTAFVIMVVRVAAHSRAKDQALVSFVVVG